MDENTQEVDVSGSQGDQQQQQQQQSQSTGLEFIPEAYRESVWAKKYSSSDDFFKGVDNLNRLVGQKQIVQGLTMPGEDAQEDEWNSFFNQMGRPESHDKYEYPEDLEIKAKGYDTATEKKLFSELAYRNGLSSKQAQGLFKDYVSAVNNSHDQFQASQPSLEIVLKDTFGDQAETNYALANKASDALGLTDKINEQGKGRDPIVLQLLAELGKGIGEDSFHTEGTSSSREELLAEAKKLQQSPEYKNNKDVQKRVEEIYKKTFPTK